jgi:mRNA-degrading endonuclease RelE of RelBE toxin-antitoxin system
VLKAVDKILVKPELGKPLGNDLAGQCSERVGGWRIFYRFDDESIVLLRCKKRDEAY